MGDVLAPRADSALDNLVFVATKSGSVEIADPFIEFIASPFSILATRPNTTDTG